MATKKNCNRNDKFNGNKYCGDPNHAGSRFFCRYVQDRLETGRRLNDFRTNKMNMSRQKFVEFLEDSGYLRISCTTLWKWEYGNGKIGDEELQALCAALKCTRDELVVYKTREIDDEPDQPVPLGNYIFYMIDECLLLQMLVFFCCPAMQEALCGGL